VGDINGGGELQHSHVTSSPLSQQQQQQQQPPHLRITFGQQRSPAVRRAGVSCAAAGRTQRRRDLLPARLRAAGDRRA